MGNRNTSAEHKLQKENTQLKELLRFANDNLRLVAPSWWDNGEGEYDFCVVCNEPEWKHTKDCKGIAWKEAVKKILQ